MTTKTTGIEWKAYYASEDPNFWPEEAYMDDVLLKVDGQEWDEDKDYSEIPDTATVVIVTGSYCPPGV